MEGVIACGNVLDWIDGRIAAVVLEFVRGCVQFEKMGGVTPPLWPWSWILRFFTEMQGPEYVPLKLFVYFGLILEIGYHDFERFLSENLAIVMGDDCLVFVFFVF